MSRVVSYSFGNVCTMQCVYRNNKTNKLIEPPLYPRSVYRNNKTDKTYIVELIELLIRERFIHQKITRVRFLPETHPPPEMFLFTVTQVSFISNLRKNSYLT